MIWHKTYRKIYDAFSEQKDKFSLVFFLSISDIFIVSFQSNVTNFRTFIYDKFLSTNSINAEKSNMR